MFSDNKKKRYQNLLGLDEMELNQFIKRYTNYLRSKSEITSNILLNGLFILDDIIQEQYKRQALVTKYTSKNLYVSKYKEEIIESYQNGNGYVKISNQLKVNHNVSVSKSTIERFVKQNNIKRKIS